MEELAAAVPGIAAAVDTATTTTTTTNRSGSAHESPPRSVVATRRQKQRAAKGLLKRLSFSGHNRGDNVEAVQGVSAVNSKSLSSLPTHLLSSPNPNLNASSASMSASASSSFRGRRRVGVAAARRVGVAAARMSGSNPHASLSSLRLDSDFFSFNEDEAATGAGDDVLSAMEGDFTQQPPFQKVPAIEDLSVLQWLETSCPSDVIPKVLAFCGPRMAATLNKCDRFWHSTLQSEATWKVLCEDLYKWSEGDPEPHSFRELYRMSPCIPVDYSTVHAALALASPPQNSNTGRLGRRNNNEPQLQRHSVRILLRPGRHMLNNAVTIQALEGVQISVETMKVPTNVFRRPPPARLMHASSSATAPSTASGRQLSSGSLGSTASQRRQSLRNLLLCTRGATDAVLDGTENESTNNDLLGGASIDMGETNTVVAGTEQPHAGATTTANWMDVHNNNYSRPPTYATLVLRTRRHNEPAFLVRQGHLILRNVQILHNSQGLDIWNGNSAVQLQPPYGPDNTPTQVQPRPQADLDRVRVTSRSGRGIVCIDGGRVAIQDCAVHDCAATGVYIGGPGSQAMLHQTDVIRNGVGNRSRRGIARGHSGVYLEQGEARILDCNISRNSLTGISAVSPDNAILNLTNTDLIANGTYQLEMPPLGTSARRRSVTDNVTMATAGPGGQLRSSLLKDAAAIKAQAAKRGGAHDSTATAAAADCNGVMSVSL